jgi:hypothetical protein
MSNAQITITSGHIVDCICGCIPSQTVPLSDAVAAVADALQGRSEYYGQYRPVTAYYGAATGIVEGALVGNAYEDYPFRVALAAA